MNVHKKIYELVEKELGKKRAILLDDILERYDNEEYWDTDLVEEIDDEKVDLKNSLRLPKEFAEKWLEELVEKVKEILIKEKII